MTSHGIIESIAETIFRMENHPNWDTCWMFAEEIYNNLEKIKALR